MPDGVLDIGRVRKLGEGFSRDAYCSYVGLDPDPDELSGAYVVRLLRPPLDGDIEVRVRREVRLLWRLAELELPFTIPRVLAVGPDCLGPAVVQSLVEGFTLDGRAPRQPGFRPWEVLGRLAAQVHAIDVSRVAGLVASERVHRRDHVMELLSVFDGLDEPELRAAHGWALEHAPKARLASTVLHGDLLPQNVKLPYGGGAPGLLDWEYAQIGDPAYDLAIITRAARKPFQVENGLERLVDAYREHGGEHVAPTDVRVHELCLLASWHREARQGAPGLGPDQTLGRIRGFLRRLDRG